MKRITIIVTLLLISCSPFKKGDRVYLDNSTDHIYTVQSVGTTHLSVYEAPNGDIPFSRVSKVSSKKNIKPIRKVICKTCSHTYKTNIYYLGTYSSNKISYKCPKCADILKNLPDTAKDTVPTNSFTDWFAFNEPYLELEYKQYLSEGNTKSKLIWAEYFYKTHIKQEGLDAFLLSFNMKGFL